ncbi:hypothetical protein MLD38_013934 [Melastoma candidum]|uniref:Uncharacterized protein n=1 Tax=Melastoma candidum TaxID=119954 RepID=A0ACB9RFC2_9MYRT|nr:hypothetical protein MLD38_013934 [Melastoma candidum]
MKVRLVLYSHSSGVISPVAFAVPCVVSTSQMFTTGISKSEDDLGATTLRSGKDLTFSFSANIWGTTLFYCDFWWEAGQGHTLTVYDDKIHSSVCAYCYWSIQATGPCLYTNVTATDKYSCYIW